mgnify:CR=1 FL=1
MSPIYQKAPETFNPLDDGWWGEMFAQSGTSVGIMAEALVVSKNFLYLLLAINVIVPDSPLSIAETPLIISLGSPMTKPSTALAISKREIKTIS